MGDNHEGKPLETRLQKCRWGPCAPRHYVCGDDDLLFCNNKMYFGSLVMWRSLVGTIAASATCAYGIGLQFKSGRLDFSAGAVMLLSAIVAGNVAQICGNNPFVFAALCMILCVLLNIEWLWYMSMAGCRSSLLRWAWHCCTSPSRRSFLMAAASSDGQRCTQAIFHFPQWP